MLRVQNLVKTFGDGARRVEALKDVTLDINDGEIFAVVGHSGAGKSTLIRCLNLLERPTSGQVFLDDTELTALSGKELRARRQKIGMIFQHFHLLDSRTVLGNVAFPLEVRGIDKSRREARAREILEIVGLADRAKEHPSRLSGGMKQRVGIARALAGSPKVLLCDEATSALDSETSRQILALLRDVNEAFGVTIVLITHDLDVVRSTASSAALISGGAIVESGAVSELAVQSDSPLGRLLLPLQQAEVGEGEQHLLLTIADMAAGSTVLSEAARDLDVNLSIRAGSIEHIAGHDVGRFQISVEDAGSHRDRAQVIDYLTDHGVRAEAVA